MVPRELEELLEPILRRLERIEDKISMADANVAALVAGFATVQATVNQLAAAWAARKGTGGGLDPADEAALETVVTELAALNTQLVSLFPTGPTGATGVTGTSGPTGGVSGPTGP